MSFLRKPIQLFIASVIISCFTVTLFHPFSAHAAADLGGGGVVGAQGAPGSCATLLYAKGDVPIYDQNGQKITTKDAKGNPVDTTQSVNKIVSSDGIVAWFCKNHMSDDRNIIQVLIEEISNYLLGLSVFVFGIMLLLGTIQIGASGASPSGIQAGKKRIAAALSSYALILLARLVLDLTGVTGGHFLGVAVRDGFTKNTIEQIIAAIVQYLIYVGGAMSVIFIIAGGIRMMTSSGNPSGIQQAKKIITYAIISLALIAGSQLVFNLIKIAITGGV